MLKGKLKGKRDIMYGVLFLAILPLLWQVFFNSSLLTFSTLSGSSATPLSISILPTANVVNVNQSVAFTNTTTGGTGNYVSFSYSVTPGVTGTNYSTAALFDVALFPELSVTFSVTI